MQETAQAEAHRQGEHYKPVGAGNWGPGKRGAVDTLAAAGKPEEVGKREEARFDETLAGAISAPQLAQKRAPSSMG